MKRYKELRQKLFEKPEFREEYSKLDLAFEISKIVAEARMIRGITQKQLAKMVGTKQPSIARLEKGSSLPSLGFLSRVALALQTRLEPLKFSSLKAQREKINYSSTSYDLSFLLNKKGFDTRTNSPLLAVSHELL